MRIQQCRVGVSKQRYVPQVVFVKLLIKWCLGIFETRFARFALLVITQGLVVSSATPTTQIVAPMASVF